MRGKIKKIALMVILTVTILIVMINGIFFVHGMMNLLGRFSFFSKAKISFESNKTEVDIKNEVVSKKKLPSLEEEKTFTEERTEDKEISEGKISKLPFQKDKKKKPAKKEVVSKKEASPLPEVKKVVRNEKGKTLLLDNFDDNTFSNNLGGSSESFGERGGICINSFYYNVNIPNTYDDRSGEYALRLSYDVSNLNSFSGFISNLNNVNLNGYQYLSFWVRGIEGGEVFKVRFRNRTETSEISIKEFLPKGLFPTWRRLVIPLKMFKGITDWEKMNGDLSIIFDYNERLVRRGVIYIDEMVFE